MHNVIMILVLSLLTSLALAGEASGKITRIEVSNNHYAVIFSLDTAIKSTPRCNESGRFSIDLRKPSGKEAYLLILEAKREHGVVRVEGLNTCANEWKSEDSKTITLE